MKIGIIRIDRMGDMILTLPIIQSIKSIDSSIKIHVFASSRNVQVIQSFKYIDRIFNINDENKFTWEEFLLLPFYPIRKNVWQLNYLDFL